MQIKTTMRYQFIYTRMAIVKKNNPDNIISVGKDVEELETSHAAGGNRV